MMKKRSIALILALVMCVCLAGCGQGAEGDSASAVSSNTPMPTEEYDRALWYGLADGTDDPERNVTQGEFDTMLTRLVELYKPEAMETWQNTSYTKEGDDNIIISTHIPHARRNSTAHAMHLRSSDFESFGVRVFQCFLVLICVNK